MLEKMLGLSKKYEPIFYVIEIIIIILSVGLVYNQLNTMNNDNKINNEQLRVSNAELKSMVEDNQLNSFGQVYEQMLDIHKMFIEHPELRLYIYSDYTPETLLPYYKEAIKNKKLANDEKLLFRMRKDQAKALAAAELMLDLFCLVTLEMTNLDEASYSWKEYIKDIYKCSPLVRKRYKDRYEWYNVEISKKIIQDAEKELKEGKINCDNVNPPNL